MWYLQSGAEYCPKCGQATVEVAECCGSDDCYVEHVAECTDPDCGYRGIVRFAMQYAGTYVDDVDDDRQMAIESIRRAS